MSSNITGGSKPLLGNQQVETTPLAAQAAKPPRLPLFWRTAIVFAAVTLIWLLLAALAHALYGQDYHRSAHVLRAVLTTLLVIPLIVWARRFLDRRPWSDLRLQPLRAALRPLLVGMLCWLLPAGLGAGAFLALGWVEITPLAPVGEILALAGGLLVLVFLYEALPEELIFRGYFYRNLAAQMPLWLAVLLQALLFTLWGILNGGENSLDRSLLFFSMSVILGIFRAVTGSVWAAVGFHLAFQTLAQLFGSVGNQFVIDPPHMLLIVAFGIVPAALGLSLLNVFYKHRPNWQELEPEDLRGEAS